MYELSVDPIDVFGVPVHIGEPVTGDMPRVGDGGGGIAGNGAANTLIAETH